MLSLSTVGTLREGMPLEASRHLELEIVEVGRIFGRRLLWLCHDYIFYFGLIVFLAGRFV